MLLDSLKLSRRKLFDRFSRKLQKDRYETRRGLNRIIKCKIPQFFAPNQLGWIKFLDPRYVGNNIFNDNTVSHLYPHTPSNSRHSPLLIPEVSCVTVSPFRRRFSTSTAFADSVAPPSR